MTNREAGQPAGSQPDTTPIDSEKTAQGADLILTVRRVSKDGGGYVVKCPHCEFVIGIEGDDLSEIRGEQFQHRRREYPGPNGPRSSGCDGWLAVSRNAVFVRELETQQ
jgi:hypothetical protein